MKTYFDTSVLLKSYVQEPGTAEALKILRDSEPPFPLSHLLEIELRTVVRLKHGRGEITAAEMRGALQALESDIAAGVLARPDYDLEEVFRKGEALSVKHAAATLARPPDIWHIAAALNASCTTLASFDDRQRKCAELAGLKITPAKRAHRKAK